MVRLSKYTDIQLNTDNFIPGPPEKRSKQYFVPLNYKDDEGNIEPLLIQTPEMRSTGGVLLSKNDYYYSDFIFSTLRFKKFLTDSENLCKDIVVNNSETWFGQPKSIDSINESFKKYNPLLPNNNLRLKYLTDSEDDKTIITTFFNHKKEQVLDDKLKTGFRVVCILRLEGIWMTKHFMGVEWKIVQLKMYRGQREYTDYLIQDNSIDTYYDNDDNDNNNQVDLDDTVSQFADDLPSHYNDSNRDYPSNDFNTIINRQIKPRIDPLLPRNSRNIRNTRDSDLDSRVSRISSISNRENSTRARLPRQPFRMPRYQPKNYNRHNRYSDSDTDSEESDTEDVEESKRQDDSDSEPDTESESESENEELEEDHDIKKVLFKKI